MDKSETNKGFIYGAASYSLWGLLPIYLSTLSPAGPIEIISARVVFSLLFCLLLLALLRRFKELRYALSDRKTFLRLSLASVLIATNWLIYVFAILNHRALEGALGYFINPIVPVLLGVFVLKEKLRPMQWLAMGIGVLAVVVITIGYGRLPWISLGLAISFGLYGFVKKGIRPGTTAIASLTVETGVLAPLGLAAAILPMLGIWQPALGSSTLLTFGPGHFWLMALAGVVTAVPLMLFAAAASRLPLSTLGILQYIGPMLQFLVALFIFREHMSPERWAGFILIWTALVILSTDMVLQARKISRLTRQTPEALQQQTR